MPANEKCAECGQPCSPKDFHDYGACILWKNGYDIKHTIEQYEAWKKRDAHTEKTDVAATARAMKGGSK